MSIDKNQVSVDTPYNQQKLFDVYQAPSMLHRQKSFDKSNEVEQQKFDKCRCALRSLSVYLNSLFDYLEYICPS